MKMFKKTISLFLALVMCLGMVNISVFADETPEHTHNEDGWTCTYTESVKTLDCKHVHNEECGYVAAVEGNDCSHVHDETCGYVEAKAEVPCDKECTDTDEDGVINHAEDCAYQPAAEGHDCNHVHDESCGYVEAQDEVSCTHEHTDECYEVVTEGYWTCTAPVVTCTKSEDCTAETHEEDCPMYVAPEDVSSPVTNETDLAAAFESNQAIITLGEGFTISQTISVTGEVTLDLNGKTLTWGETAKADGSCLFQVGEGAALTITDSTNTVGYTKDYTVTTSTANEDGTTVETTETRTATVKGGSIRATTADSTTSGDDTQFAAVISVSGGMLTLENGIIDGNNNVRGILVENNGAVIMKGGAVINGKALLSGGGQYGCGIYVRNGRLDMTGGIVAENNNANGAWYDEYRRGGGIALRNGSLDVSGGVIAGNRAGIGGGIFAGGGSGNITIRDNAVIANNRTIYSGGGGVSVDGSYTIAVQNGALITGNVAKMGGGGVSGGGGTKLEVQSGAVITGNEAHTGGGINSSGAFEMTGGIVAGNIARGNTGGDTNGDGEGGGIRIGSGSAVITGGYITNNETRTTVDWGGGGIFISQSATIQFKNLLITGNEAQGLGGGIGGCSTGQLAISATDGVASFGNIAYGHKENGAHAAHKWQDQAALKNNDFLYYGSNDFFCAHSSYVTDAMLGGGSANWHGSKDTGTGYRGNSAENGEIDVQQLAIPQGGADAAAFLMGLSADPSEEAKTAAYGAAHVFITGNKSSTHGGGIMCNGTMFAGAIEENAETKFSSVSVEATKAFQNADGTPIPMAGGEFTFALVKDADFNIVDSKPSYAKAQTAVNDANGKVLFTINDLTQADTYTYYLVEEPGTGLITYDPTIYKVTVEVSKGQEITWKIDTKLTATVYNGSVKSIVPMTVDENGALVEVEAVDSAVFTNTYSGDLAVNKVWAGDNDEAVRPKNVTVQLYKNGTAEGEAVTLNEANGWSCKWTGLAYGAAYTVKELNVPDGYTSAQNQAGNVVTITNTYTAPEPETVSLTLMKDLTSNASGYEDTLFTFKVTLSDGAGNGLSGTFGGVEFADGVAEVQVSKNHPVVLTGIPQGTSYTVEETGLDSNWVQPTESSGSLSNPETNVTITNSRTSSSGGGDGDETRTTNLTVNKVWEGDEDTVRPASVTVRRLRNGTPYGLVVTLDESNGWSHTWNNLNDSYEWSVDEVDVPEGYTKEVTGSGTAYTITNTYTVTDVPDENTPTTDIPNEPEDTPDEPVDTPDEQPPLVDVPDEQPPLVVWPEVPDNTYPTEVPEEQPPLAEIPEEQPPLAEIPDENVPMVGVPQTGDISLAWYAAAIVSALGLAVLTLTKRKDEEN